MTFTPGYGQGIDSVVHRTKEDGDSYCGEATTTVGDASSSADLVHNHGYQYCYRCSYAIAMIELAE